jgi:hypothetical protein
MDQIVNNAAKIRYIFGGEATCPLVIRTPGGGGNQLTAQHSQSFDAWFAHVPGLKAVTPARPADAHGLLKSAIRDDDPVLFLENLPLYKDEGEVSEDADALTPIGRARVARERGDLTIVAHSYAVVRALRVAEQLADEHDVSVEVVDLRTLRPLDFDTVAESVAKTTCAVRRGGLVDLRDHGRARGADPRRVLRLARRSRRAGGRRRGPDAVRQEPRAGRAARGGQDRGRRPPRPRSVRFHDPGGHEPRAARARSRAGPAPSTPPIATVFGLTTSVSDSSPSSRPLRQTRSRLGPGSARRRSER